MGRKLAIQKYLELCKNAEERMVMAIVIYEAITQGHGDEVPSGIAEFALEEFSKVTRLPLGEGLRLLKALAERTGGVCVVNDTDLVLFAINGAVQSVFDRLYESRGFEGQPPRLPNPNPHIR
jgi:hypothetical protein